MFSSLQLYSDPIKAAELRLPFAKYLEFLQISLAKLNLMCYSKKNLCGGPSWSLRLMLHSLTFTTITFLTAKSNCDLCCICILYACIFRRRTGSLLCGVFLF